MKKENKKVTKSAAFWGVSLIIIALLLIFNAIGVQVGFLDIGGLPVLRIILGGLCLASAVFAITRGNIWQIFFPLGFIALLFEGEIAKLCNAPTEDIYSVWLVLGVSLLLTIGTSLLGFSNGKIEVGTKCDVGEKDRIGKNNLSSAVKYIDCTDFGIKDVGNNLGAMSVYFENPEKYTGDGILCIGNNLGSTTVFLPERWKADVKVDHNLGFCGNYANGGDSDLTVQIRVKSNLGKLSIVRMGDESAAYAGEDDDDDEDEN